MAQRFEGKVAFVTGGARGIGAATARRLASEGAAVAVVDLVADSAAGTAEEITRAGGRALALGADVSARWDAVLSVHLTGAFRCAQAAQAVFVAQRYGRIVNLSSTSALGNRGQANYSAAKAGIQGLTRTLALELGRFGVTANAVAPGFIATAMTEATAARMGLSFEDFQHRVAESVALQRVGEPEDVAAVIAFLASDDASYVSGQTVYVDGGGRL